jgi:hypothetical protein
MKSNISQADKLIRIALGLSLGLIAVFTQIIWLGIIGIIILVTGLINYCPIYGILGYTTRKYHASPYHAKPKKKNHHH